MGARLNSAVLIYLGTITTLSLIAFVFNRSRTTIASLSVLWLIAGVDAVRCASAGGEFVECTGPVFWLVLIALLLISMWALLKHEGLNTREIPLYQLHWDGVCRVLGEGHKHTPCAVQGAYEGYSVEVLAHCVGGEPQARLMSIHEVRLRCGLGGRPWLLRRRRHKSTSGPSKWTIVARPESCRRQLEDAGMLLVAETASGLDPGSDPRIAYLPEDGTLAYKDPTGLVTDAETLRRRLDTLLSLNAINHQHNDR